MHEPLLTIRDLHKRFPGKNGAQASDGVFLDVYAGEVIGLLGHNGAGKTSLINQIVGLVKPDSGSVTLDGIDAIAHPGKARALSCVQAQANVPITGLTPARAITQVGRIRGLSQKKAVENTDALIDALDLGAWAHIPAQKISGGIARLTAFAMAAVAPSKLVVLDEPTNDVDPVRRQLLWAQIRMLADQGAAVLLVTHNVREAEHVVDRVAILDSGRVIREGSRNDVMAGLEKHLTLEVHMVTSPPEWPHTVSPQRHRAMRWVGVAPSSCAEDLIRWAEARVNAGEMTRYALAPVSLEDVYIGLVGTGSTEIEEHAA